MNDVHPDLPPTAYVVDDDESIRTLWRWLMESNGIAVRTFARAAEFIESYRNGDAGRSEEHTSELQSRLHLVCRLLLEKKKKYIEKIRRCMNACGGTVT